MVSKNPLLLKEGIKGWFNLFMIIFHHALHEIIPIQPPPAPPYKGEEYSCPVS